MIGHEVRVRTTGYGGFVTYCSCGHDDDYADHLVIVLAERDRRIKAEAVLDFAHWVAINRAYNGSEHVRGQSLYNESLNAVLPQWAVDYAIEAADV